MDETEQTEYQARYMSQFQVYLEGLSLQQLLDSYASGSTILAYTQSRKTALQFFANARFIHRGEPPVLSRVTRFIPGGGQRLEIYWPLLLTMIGAEIERRLTLDTIPL